MPDTSIVVAEQAVDTIRDMKHQALTIEHAWGRNRPEYATKALTSLTHNLAELFSSAFSTDVKIFRDGELSLYVTAGIHFGVIFHGKHRDVTAPVEGDPDLSHGAKYAGRYCIAALDDGEPCLAPYTWRGGHTDDGGVPTCEGHDTLTATLPVPGEWSFHS